MYRRSPNQINEVPLRLNRHPYKYLVLSLKNVPLTVAFVRCQRKNNLSQKVFLYRVRHSVFIIFVSRKPKTISINDSFANNKLFLAVLLQDLSAESLSFFQ